MAGTVCWAGMAQPVDPIGQFIPVDLGAISGFAQRLPPAAHELRALALNMQKHVYGDPLPPANPPARWSWSGAQLAVKSKTAQTDLAKCVFFFHQITSHGPAGH